MLLAAVSTGSLHQILQWHHMVTRAGYPPDSVRNLTITTLFDGLFHAATWIATVGLSAWSGDRLLGGLGDGASSPSARCS